MGAPALALRYKWEPGSEDDGVNVGVPLAALDRLAAEGLEWQVPGLREELVLALLRSLPKEVRRRLVPLPERAAEFLARAGPADGPLPAVLARWLAAAAGADISPADFDWEKLPPYLRPTFHLVGEDGRLFASGKDLGELWSCVQPMLGRALGEAARAGSLERSGLKTWDFGELPKVFEPVWQGCRLKGYPALVDDGDSVSVRVLTDGAAQSGAMVAGTRRLLLLSLSSQQQRLDRFERLLDNPTRLAVSTGPQPAYRSVRELVEDVAAGAVDQIVEAQGGPAWERGEFWELRSAVVAQFDPVVSKAVLAAGRLLRESQDVRRWLDDLSERAANLPKPAPLQLALADIDRQLVYLAGPRFVSRAGLGRLADIERYLRAMGRRLETLQRDPGRDVALMRRVQVLEERLAEAVGVARSERGWAGGAGWAEAGGAGGAGVAGVAGWAGVGVLEQLEGVRWMIEELRVSFFAQSLGTRMSVSEERVLRAIARAAAGAPA